MKDLPCLTLILGFFQFYLAEQDMNVNRAKASIKKLSELNSYVPVNLHEGDLQNEFLVNFQVNELLCFPISVYTDTILTEWVLMLNSTSVARSQFGNCARIIQKICQIHQNYAKRHIKALLFEKEAHIPE